MRFVHIGIHKTGSTLLQRTLFANPDAVTVLGAQGSPHALNLHCRQLWSRDYGCIDLARWSEVFTELCADHGLNRDVLALSDENLSGHMITGAGHRLIAERLAKLWADTKVLVVLRDPVDYVLSAYDEYTRLGGAASLRTLCHDRVFPGSLINRLDYLGLVNNYYELFGQEAVLVLPYELLVNDQITFARLVAKHLQIDVRSRDYNTLSVRYNVRSSGPRRTITRVGNFLGTRRTITWRARPRYARTTKTRWLHHRFRSATLDALLSITDEDSQRDLTPHDLLASSRMKFWSGFLERYNYSVIPLNAATSAGSLADRQR